MDQDDGCAAHPGTNGIGRAVRRQALSRPLCESNDGTWQTERVVFHDLGTGATVVRLTNDPWADSLSYFKGNWSADGQYVVFRRQPGMWEGSTATHGPMAVRSDGTGLRNVFRDYRMVRGEVCSPSEPDICYAMADGHKLVAFDLRTGKTHHVVRQVPGCWHLKISPDGKYLMGRSDLEQGRARAVDRQRRRREYHEIPVPESIHDSYQFHPSQKKIMFWYEDRYRKEGFVQCDFDGRNMTKVPVQFDWNHGDVGPDRGVHTERLYYTNQGKHVACEGAAFSSAGRGVLRQPGPLQRLPDVEADGPAVGLRHADSCPAVPFGDSGVSAEPVPDDVVNRFRICYTGLQRAGPWTVPGPAPTGRRCSSTRTCLAGVDVYYVVARLPERPTGLKAERVAGGVKLTWKAPPHHAEIAGYNIYRGTQSGVGLPPVSRMPYQVAGGARQHDTGRRDDVLRRLGGGTFRPGKWPERRGGCRQHGGHQAARIR